MKVGMATGGVQPPISLSDDEFRRMVEGVRGQVDPERLRKILEAAFDGGLRWAFFHEDRASWADTKPKLQQLHSVLQEAAVGLLAFQIAIPPTPQAAAVHLLREHDRTGSYEAGLSIRELRSRTLELERLARQALEQASADAAVSGREPKRIFRSIVFNIEKSLEENGLSAPISTSRYSNTRQSIFWESVIDAYSRLRVIDHAGCASRAAALELVKRSRRDFHEGKGEREAAAAEFRRKMKEADEARVNVSRSAGAKGGGLLD